MTSTTAAPAALDATRGALTRFSAWARRRTIFIAPVLVYLILVLLGVTTSNIGISSLREDPASPLGLQIGGSQGIRSDEWGTESPIWLGQLARGGAEDPTPLSVSNDFFAQLPAGPVSSVVFFDGSMLSLGTILPQEMLFAAKWWLPALLLFIGLPIWFRQVGAGARWGYLAGVLIMVAPGSAWWSGRPVNTLGFVAAGCALGIYGATALGRRQWGRGIVAVLACGILLARLPTYYQPLAIVVGIPIVVATAAVILARAAPWRERVLALGAVGVSGLGWTALIFWENRSAVMAGLGTVYPGDRQSTGGATSPGMVFGATNLGKMEALGRDTPLNQSEAATAFTVLLVVLVLLFATQRWRGSRVLATALIPIVALGLFWLSWGTMSWGSLGSHIPIVNRVPNTRAMLGVGYIAIIAFCLFMSQWRPPRRQAVAVVAASAAAFLSGYGGSSLQETTMPGLTTWYIWACALGTGAVVYALVAFSQHRWPLVLAGVAALSLTATAQPILFGLGDLRASTTAQKFMAWGAESMSDGTVWASPSQDVDSLMMATGTPSLSARQQIGPDVDEWRKLDPEGAYEQLWNRGGLHIMFEWTDNDDITFAQPVADTIIVQTSPCVVAERIESFTHAVSASPLDGPCLTQRDSFTWGGINYFVYDVER
ncbi:DUF7657 domain-containing protein [Microbacterium sp. bgisy203]|uniref:DUF7657 domain-containing protein n=1 Tax=Microbacterium sp. bgisy203 TaxID=3413799 RepID=UPI003D7097E1